MNAPQSVERDERALAVENASYKWACIVLTYALFIDMLYRVLIRHENAWDLLALVIAGGAVSIVYQARHKTLGHGWARKGMLIFLLGGVIGAIVVVILVMTKTR